MRCQQNCVIFPQCCKPGSQNTGAMGMKPASEQIHTGRDQGQGDRQAVDGFQQIPICKRLKKGDDNDQKLKLGNNCFKPESGKHAFRP